MTTGETPEELRSQVTSPGGTTAAGPSHPRESCRALRVSRSGRRRGGTQSPNGAVEGHSNLQPWRPRVFDRGELSEPTIARLPVYHASPRVGKLRGLNRIDSQQIGVLAGVTATTVRRDLAGLGSFGTRGAGYDVQVLNEHIAEALGHDRRYDVVVVGIGNLGRALVNSTNFLIRGAQLAALYDNDPDVGTTIAGSRGQVAR